ncbi:hypothetical protein EVAR_18202_1 [Eumeta japonica]|uniref:Uncharacterized protein n=1 Tax=Eumeta variegata TaxID=151549 RepID=A0A4C1UV73_EUMVA|nr:hypothetical protein EVAR_18202_1 [Eumeta japonica]
MIPEGQLSTVTHWFLVSSLTKPDLQNSQFCSSDRKTSVQQAGYRSRGTLNRKSGTPRCRRKLADYLDSKSLLLQTLSRHRHLSIERALEMKLYFVQALWSKKEH